MFDKYNKKRQKEQDNNYAWKKSTKREGKEKFTDVEITF